jgi:hypothetical protein
LEGIPPPSSDLERSQISEILSGIVSATENVHHIANQCCRMTFSRSGDIPYAILLSPNIGGRTKTPDIIEEDLAIGASEAISGQLCRICGFRC